MIERLLLVLALLALGFAAYTLFARWQLRRAVAHAPTDPLLAAVRRDQPTILYFTTPTCAPCRYQQTPILQRLEQELNGLQVIRVDATEDPEAARRWGVMSVPTTFVIDRQGKPRGVYNGVVDADTLKRELMVS